MSAAAKQAPENVVLRERLSRLRESSLRINERLDFDSVLQEVLDSARWLTDARYGALALLNDAGEILDWVTSGLTPEEHQQVLALSWGPALFDHLGQIAEPLRVRDFHRYTQTLGLPAFRSPMPTRPELALMAAPVQHQGARVGTIYVADQTNGQDFTAEDEATLVLFASQAALVIANARRCRDEQRARTDLEALINTSPVGVVVLDAKTGVPVSTNQETSRILEGLWKPGQSAEEGLESVTVRRADGREISLEELSVVEAMSSGETVRAEEIVFEVPDGRRVTALVNAAPIRSAEGSIDSFVVTLQDMSPVEELERLRAEFLAMVSHELRAPLTSIKGSAATLLQSLASLDPAETMQFVRIIESEADRMRGLISELLDIAHIETGTLVVAPQPVAVASLIDEARSVFLSGGNRDRLSMDVEPDLPWAMADRRRIVQVFTSLLTNAAKYSDESSGIRVAAVREGVYAEISVEDEGQGIPPEHLPHLFRKYSRVDRGEVARDGPRAGLGLAICKGIVEAHGGRIWAESDGEGLGTRFSFTLPLADQRRVVDRRALPRPGTALTEPPGERKRVLVLDDDPQTLRYVLHALRQAGYAPLVSADPQEALRLVDSDKPHVVLMDLVLPGADGIALMQQILDTADVPVIFLSDYGRDQIIAKAFETGAADYMVKPFSPTELVARVEAALQRPPLQRRISLPEAFTLGDLRIAYSERHVALAGRPVQLTSAEYDLLVELSINVGRVISHRDLLSRVWGGKRPGGAGAVRTLVKRLRHKLNDDARRPTYIFTEPRVGYRLGTSADWADAE